MDKLNIIIEEIGRLSDTAEIRRWEVAGRIAEAYSELPAYHRGLTAGLCNRLRKSSDTIYGMRNAEELRSRLRVDPVLSVSHFVTLHELVTRYDLSDESVRDWIEHAEECSLSVRELRQAVSDAHILDAKAHWKRKVARIGKLMTAIMLEAEGAGVSEKIYQSTKTVVLVVADWHKEVDGWN